MALHVLVGRSCFVSFQVLMRDSPPRKKHLSMAKHSADSPSPLSSFPSFEMVVIDSMEVSQKVVNKNNWFWPFGMSK